MSDRNAGIQKMKEAASTLRSDINDLESEFERWDGENRAFAREYRLIAGRIVASARRLKNLVAENSIP